MSDPTPDASAAQWSARYEAEDTPWDLGAPHPDLVRRLEEDPGLGGAPGRVLVPGCGRGHDALALARAGWQVVAVDMAPAVDDLVRAALEPFDGRFVVADLFDDDALDGALGGRPVDLVFDHTLFCALPLHHRPDFGATCRRVLGPDGQVVSVVFPIGRDHAEGGPPWGMTPEAVDLSLGAEFRRTETSDLLEVTGRAWPHRWCRWSRAA